MGLSGAGTRDTPMNIDVTHVDAQGLDCPMPLLLAKRALNGMTVGQQLELLATDGASQRDFEVFVQQTGHLMVASSEAEGVYTFLIEKR